MTYAIKARQKGFSLSGEATVGWRGKAHWALGIDIGVAAGFQYVAEDSTFASAVATANDFHGILPLFQLSLGYSF